MELLTFLSSWLAASSPMGLMPGLPVCPFPLPLPYTLLLEGPVMPKRGQGGRWESEE